MKIRINKLILCVLAMAIGSFTAQAQYSTTPYSRVGYGILNDNASGIQRSMGGVGIAMQNGRQVNVMNPASYACVDSLTFLWDLGFDLSNVWSSETGKSGHSFSGGLDYITTQFRITKGLGGSFGLLPYSNVGYSYAAKLDNGAEARMGEGGLSKLYVGLGYSPVKGLSFGVNVGYLFGTIANTTLVVGNSTAMFQRSLEIRDYDVNAGLQYAFNVSPKDRIVLGATYTPRKSYHGHTWGIYYDETIDIEADTVGYGSLKGSHEQAESYGAGISYAHGDRLMVEADFLYQPWSKAKYTKLEGFEGSSTTLGDRWKAAFGLSYTPNSRGAYYKRMTYRVGAFYNHDYLNIQGNNVRDYGVGIGFTFPAPSSKTLVNLGLEWRHRYSAPTVYITEDYLNITLSVNFNELWFWKNKIR